MALQLYQILFIVRTVLIAIAVVPATVLFAKLLRKPGYRHDNTRRWVDYTKSALGLWILTQLILIICWIILAVSVDVIYWGPYSRAERVVGALGQIQTFFGAVDHVFIYLALFYLAHALTLLRTGGEPASKAFRRGRGFSIAGSTLVILLSFLAFCLYLSVMFSNRYSDSDILNIKLLVSMCFMIAYQGIFLIMAIGSVVYSAKSRKKALGTSVAKAGTLLVVCSSLFLVREAWEMVMFFFGGRTYVSYFFAFEIVDIFAGSYLSLSILTMLYVMATKESYSLSKVHYRTKVAEEEQTV